MAKLHDYYRDQVVNELKNKFGYKSVMQVPRIEKITLAMVYQNGKSFFWQFLD